MRHRLAAIAVLLAAMAATPPAAARPSDQARRVEGAVRAMERGVKMLSQGRPAEALAEFEHATELVPDADQPYRRAAEALELLGRPAVSPVVRNRGNLNIQPRSGAIARSAG